MTRAYSQLVMRRKNVFQLSFISKCTFSRFFMFTWQLLLWKQIHAIMQLINPNFYISEQYESKSSRLLKKNCCKFVSSTQLLRTNTLTMGSKCGKHFVFGFLLPLVVYLSEFDLFKISYFW